MNKNITIALPDTVAFILHQLEKNGFEAFAVGGCVRDSIISRHPQDWDIASSARPEEVKKIFSKTIDTGLKHGTVTVLQGRNTYEITTYRIDGRYINNRKPESVEFTDSLEEDLSRRDFTINAMAYNPVHGLIDPFGGLEDIEIKQIKAVGKGEQRFKEDALRMLRAVRFSAQIGYGIEPHTLEAITGNSSLINNISGERIREELNKTLIADPMAFVLLHSTGILKEILPEFDLCFYTEQKNPYHIYNVAIHSLHAASSIENSSLLRWAMLLHDIGKPDSISIDSAGINHFYMHQIAGAEKAEQVLQRLRFDNATIAVVKKLILEHDRQIGDSEKSVRKAIAAIGADLFEPWLQLQMADINAQSPDKAQIGIAKLNTVSEIYRKIISEKQCLVIKDLAVSGRDLMDIGYPQGKHLGTVLQQLLEDVLEQPELNERDTLLKLAREYM